MAPPLLFLKDIRLSFGSTPLLAGAELSIAPFERLCLVGRNGSGKSTVLKIAAGMIEPDAGTRFVQPSVTIRYLPQSPDLSGFAATAAFVEAGLAPGDDPHRARYLLESLGLTGEEDPAHLSGGESRRAALARVLAPEPDILLLDEPTNHLDVVAIEGLEAVLKTMRSAIVLISHDRRFLENLSEATLWLDRGTTRLLDKGFAAFEAWRDAILEAEEIERHKLDRRIVQEEHWLRYGVSARRKRNQRRLEGLLSLRGERKRALHARASGAGGERSGEESDRGEAHQQILWRPQAGRRLQHQDRQRRPYRHRGSERRRQDDAHQSAHRHACSRHRHREARHQSRNRHARPAASKSRPRGVGRRHADRRQQRFGGYRRRASPRHLLHEGLSV
jgi:ATP-binding cassette subfamily F protein uup